MSHSPTTVTHSRSNPNPNPISGIGIDTIYLEVPLAGLPGNLEFAPSLEGFFQTVHPRWKWALQHRHLANLWIGARDVMVTTKGRCAAGTLRVRLSVAELISSVAGSKGNLGQVTPARLHEILSTLLDDLGDALGAPGLAGRCEVTRLDVFADLLTTHAGQALAVFKDRMVLVSRRAARQGKSFTVGDNLEHVSLARRKGSGRSTEPTVVYDKGRQMGREDLHGLVRFEVVQGAGKRSKDPLSIQGACNADLWRALLRDRLLELGLERDVKIKVPSDLQAAAMLLIKDGINPAQAALYALQCLDPAKFLTGEKKLARALRENRKNVEARTRLRLSAARTDPTFIRDLWTLIEGAQLEDPQDGPVPYDDEVSQALGLRPRDGAYDPSSLILPNVDHLLGGSGIHELDLGTPSQPDHHDDLPVSGPPGHHHHETVQVSRPAKRSKAPKVHPKTGSPTDGPYDLSFLDNLPAIGGAARGLKAVRELQLVPADGWATHGEHMDGSIQVSVQTPSLNACTPPGEGDCDGKEVGGCFEETDVLCRGGREGVRGVTDYKKGGRILSQMTSEGAAPLESTPEVVLGVEDLLAGILADG